MALVASILTRWDSWDSQNQELYGLNVPGDMIELR